MTDSNATDELRRLLDERGVEYRVNETTKVFEWYFDGTDGEGSAHATEVNGGINIMACSLTPAQAIAATLGGDDKSRWFQLFGTPERAARTVMRYLFDGCEGAECADGCPFYDVRYLTNCVLASNTSAHELRVWLEGDAE